MLSSSFQHLDGISERRERELWRSGIVSWDDLDAKLSNQLALFRNHAQHAYSRTLAESRAAIERADAAFFAGRLPKREHYKIALAFPERTAFLDIETTGLSRYYDEITVVGWSIGSLYGAYIKGTDPKALRKALTQAKVIVTFNGSLFDLPFLRHEFPDLPLPDAHVDLRFLARRAGLTGPQKKIERQLGFARDDDLAEVDGKVAPVLWHRYRRGERDALMRLIRYNHADIEGMKQIFDVVIGRLVERGETPSPVCPSTRFSDSRSTIVWSVGRRSQAGAVIRVPRFKGKPGPATTFRELAETAPLEQLRVVGIDLTGSERRASGWCLTVGPHATTALVHSDEELVKKTLDSRPDLVSIDSPLSLPSGRTSVSDDDPGRATAGIMRWCERVLRQRGISVYPCLIPSMQRLTERGIRLAAALRSRGVPVIESYPGAAQDILGIPRKRASLDLLASGLSDFGFIGPWTRENTTHDELDAITSSLVGLFFWAGRFEALGNEAEGYLIVPALKADEQAWTNRIVIGISGPIAAGKTTAAKFLEQRGFHYGRFSEVLAGC